MSVQQFQYEADTTIAPATLFYPEGIESGAIAQTMVSAPTDGTTSESLTYLSNPNGHSWGWVSPANVPNLTSWPAQTYTITLNIASPNANLKITEVKVYRVDSNGGPSTSGLATVGDLSGLSQSLGAAGSLTFSVSGSAQTASLTDRIAVKFYVTNTASSTQSFSYLAGSGSGSGMNVGGSGTLPTSTTGFNPWWTYYNGALPGQGSYGINVGNGNLLAKVLDFDTPERGVDLAFQRVYNSQSTHDANNSDASNPGNYGDGWTSSFDAHIAYHGSNAISVYDIDGTRFDYTADGNGNWTPPAGQYASLKWDGSCGYQWFKPNGTVYYFYSPDLNAGTPSRSGLSVVQTKTGSANTVSSYSAPALSSAPRTGNLLVLAVGYDHSQSDVSTSLTGWTFVGKSTNDPTFWNTVYIWEKVVQSGDTGAATITSTSAHEFSSVEYEISGENPSSPYEAFATSTAQNNTTLSVTSGAPTTANDLPIAFFENRNYTTSGVGTGWTEDATATSNGTRVEAQHGAIDTNSSAQTAQLTWSTAGYPVAAIMLIQPAGQSVSCTQPYPSGSAYGGRLYQIWGRNYNNKVTLTYSWTGGDASNPANLTGITATHSDGDSVTLSFGLVNGSPELSSVTRPDAKTLTYAYTGTNLTEVDLPGTNGPSTSAIPTIRETYQYGASHLLTAAISPTYNQSGGAAGDQTIFHYDGSNRVSQIQDSGVVNFSPNDGTATNLQSGATGVQTWITTNFTWLSGETELSDMYAHYINWFPDALGRVTKVQRYSYAPSGAGVWLTSALSWDSSNNLLSTVDPRGMVGATPDPTYETDYAYDTAGDLVAAAQPSVTVNNGTYRPTSVFSYDGNHNLTASCDPVQSHVLGLDWSGSGQSGNPGTSSSRCPSSTGSVRYTWDTSDANEPYGRVSNYYTANGYRYGVTYNVAGEANVDAGLPTAITGDPISQGADTTTPSRVPSQTITYDAKGNVISSDDGKGAATYAYDRMNRTISTSDPDSVAQYACYNDNGSVLYTETASQHAADGSPAACATPLPSSVAPPANAVSYTYDSDGNSIAEVHHYGNIAGTTTRYYDAGDRLVEVQLPLDSTVFPNTTIKHDLYPQPWMARYLYDNTGALLWNDGSGNGVYGDGNLYKVQEYLPSTPVIAVGTAPAAQTWTDVRGWAWDPLDVPVHVYEFALGTSPRLSYTYNGSNSTMGMLYQMFYGEGPSSTNPTVTPTYLANGWVQQASYSNDGGLTPVKSYTYDADGRPTVLNSSAFGNEARSYDNDGNLTGVIEPNTYGGYGNISYTYFADDLRQGISVSSSALSNGATKTLSYGYRTDGLPEVIQPSWTGAANFSVTYTNAGRISTESDPYTGQSIPIYNQYGTATGQSLTLVKRQAGYDSYGRLSQLILPEGYTYGEPSGQSGTFTYDGEDEPTSYQVSNGLCNSGSSVVTCAASTKSITYSARGEILATSDSGNRQSADGFLCTPYSSGCREQFDSRNGMVYKIYESGSQAGYPSYSYDSYGRNTGVTMYSNTVTRAYDADSHIAYQKNLSGTSIPCFSNIELGCDPDTGNVDPNSGVTYTWGTNGHPVEIGSNLGGGSTTTTYWEHWDPVTNAVLFENSNAYGAATALALGHLGISNATNGVTVEDRGLGGETAATHTGSQFTVWTSAPASRPIGRYVQTLTGGTGSNFTGSDPQLAGRVLDASRPDAFVDHTYGISFQGVRTADTNSGLWMTPDWFTGYDGDLMSQQPYMWNNNNGLMYSDPSGYCGTSVNGGPFVHSPGPPCNTIVSALGGEDFLDILGAIGPSSGDFTLIFDPIPIAKVVGNQNLFIQGCYNVKALKGGGGCVIVDACGDVVAGPAAGLPGASVDVGNAFPFPGHNAQGIYTGLSGTGGFHEGPGGQVSGNLSGIAPAVGIGIGRWGLSGSYGFKIPGTGGCGKPK